MRLADCVLAIDELIFRLEVSQFPLLKHRDDIGHLSRSGFSPVAMSQWIQFGELVGVPGAFGVRLQLGFASGRLTNSNVATWVLSNQDSSVAPQTLQDA